MKQIKSYLFPIFIMLGISYLAGCLMGDTISLSGMSEEIRKFVFVIWLGASGIFASIKAIGDYDKK